MSTVYFLIVHCQWLLDQLVLQAASSDECAHASNFLQVSRKMLYLCWVWRFHIKGDQSM